MMNCQWNSLWFQHASPNFFPAPGNRHELWPSHARQHVASQGAIPGAGPHFATSEQMSAITARSKKHYHET
jgi:hypothetical protein